MKLKTFKKKVISILAELKIQPSKMVWQKESRFQKARYKKEYVFPEVWIYKGEMPAGLCLNGESFVEDGGENYVREYLSANLA